MLRVQAGPVVARLGEDIAATLPSGAQMADTRITDSNFRIENLGSVTLNIQLGDDLIVLHSGEDLIVGEGAADLSGALLLLPF